ncbi:MAG: DUF2164 domain-containing protein [Myxococcales bacterium]|nr:DUF2164 domain-containing protein [Myxococcales bacterium]
MANDTMRIQLSEERRERVLGSIARFFDDKLDREISVFQAEQLLDFMVLELGAPVYNQAIRDAHGFLQEKLSDLEGEFYEPEDSYDRQGS